MTNPVSGICWIANLDCFHLHDGEEQPLLDREGFPDFAAGWFWVPKVHKFDKLLRYLVELVGPKAQPASHQVTPPRMLHSGVLI